MNKSALAILALAFTSVSAMAQDATYQDMGNAYVGLAGGGINSKISVGGYDLEGSSSITSLIGGYNFNLGGGYFVGLEGDLNTFDFDNSFYSIRARGGIAMPDLSLAYVTAGYAGLSVEGESFDGWALGTGYDYALTGNVKLRAEYMFIQHDIEGFDLNTNALRAGVLMDF
ncbi:MAG: porin family protein [Aestuariivirgaceae bacterium]|nr:porin family protein [Aestuariivirgaceae bacterium]